MTSQVFFYGWDFSSFRYRFQSVFLNCIYLMFLFCLILEELTATLPF